MIQKVKRACGFVWKWNKEIVEYSIKECVNLCIHNNNFKAD